MEVYRHKYEEFWIVTNILSQDKNLKNILNFYLNCRATIIEVCNVDNLTLLDDIAVNFEQLHLIMTSIFKHKATLKMHLIQKLKSEPKGYYYFI